MIDAIVRNQTSYLLSAATFVQWEMVESGNGEKWTESGGSGVDASDLSCATGVLSSVLRMV